MPRAMFLVSSLVIALSASGNPSDPKHPQRFEGPESDARSTVRDDGSEPEEVVVTGTAPDPWQVHGYEYMQQTYDSRGKGSCLYRRGDFEEAFPYLLAAAKRGFKFAQARVSFLYERGLGTLRDTEAAVGWLAVAATGTTHPAIRNTFKDAWQRIPAQSLPRLEEVADEYRSKYGARRHRVACDLAGTTRSRIKKLTCRFRDEANFLDFNSGFNAAPNPGGSGC